MDDASKDIFWLKPVAFDFRRKWTERFENIHLISDYIDSRKLEIDAYNTILINLSINGRNLTNLGLFRKYITEYLFHYPELNKDMLMLCRQLQSTAHGVPLEVYAFSHDKFENYVRYVWYFRSHHCFGPLFWFRDFWIGYGYRLRAIKCVVGLYFI
jgi:hypothetical protein